MYRIMLIVGTLLMAVSLVFVFIFSPPAKVLGDTARILYLHVPVAWISVVSFLLSGLHALMFLYTKKKLYASRMHNAVELGIVFIVLTTVSGAIWAKAAWGSYWNWDPRETSVVILLMIYLGYFALAGNKAYTNKEAGAAYLIFATLVMPILVFVIPRIYFSLHPSPIISGKSRVGLDWSMRLTLLLSVLAYSVMFGLLYSLRNRISTLELQQKGDN